MAMDWNWFFSSVAQSAAAIVGIFGAFIVTKILSNQATFSEKKSRLKELVRAAEKLAADASSLSFEWYNKRTTERKLSKVKELLEGGAPESAAHLYEQVEFSPYIAKEKVIQLIESAIEQKHERERQKEEQARARAQAKKPRGLSMSPFDAGLTLIDPGPISLNYNNDLSNQLENEREMIDASVRECRHHISKIKDFRDSITGNPESSTQITYTLLLVTVLFYVGVIYPLCFMPLATAPSADWSPGALPAHVISMKGALLGCVAVIFTGVLWMFLKMNLDLKYPESEQAELERLSFLGAYSQYFAVMEGNQSARAKLSETAERASGRTS